MLNKLKEAIKQTTQQKETHIPQKRDYESSSLSSPVVGEKTQKILNNIQANQNFNNIPYSNPLEEMAGIFSTGDYNSVTNMVKNHINQQKGNVEEIYWLILFDCLQLNNDRADFIKIADTYAKVKGISPPSWKSRQIETSSFGGENLLIIPKILEEDFKENIIKFTKASIQYNLARINLSSCDFEQADTDMLLFLFNYIKRLDYRKTPIQYIGSQNLIDFCKKYTLPADSIHKTFIPENNKYRETEFKQNILEQQQLIYLIYLDVLQREDNKSEYEQIASNYATLFEQSPPGWEEGKITNTYNLKDNKEKKDFFQTHNVINTNNINDLLKLINEQINNDSNDIIKLDFSNIERVEYPSATLMTTHIQELNNNKPFIIINVNHLTDTILEMVGLKEYCQIIIKKQ